MKKRILYILFVVLSFAGTTSQAQVINAPRLECVTKNNSNGDITLSWSTPTNNCGAFVQYTIYGSPVSANGPYDSVIAVTTPGTTTYTLPNYLAVSGTWYFYMTATYNCPGYTTLQSDTVDTNPPAIPQIVNVTVTPAGQAVINWAPDPSPQTTYYIIYYYLPNGNAAVIDTVYGRLNTTTTDVTGQADSNSLVYTIAAADSCGNISSYTNDWHNTILAHASITECQRQLSLTWNPYNHWPQGVARYEIWVSTNLGPYTLVDTTDASTLLYFYDNFNDGDSLDIFVRAISAADNNIVSNSNLLPIHALIVQPPSYIYITNLTVDANNHIDVTWTVDTIAQLILYEINRGTDTSNISSLVSFPVPSPLQHFQTFIDSGNVTPQNNSYVYNIIALDSCQNQYPAPYGQTVNLQGILYEYYVAQLKWNDFVLQYANVLHYNLYRDFGNGYQLIQTFPPGVNLYYDSLQQFLNENGTFCYKIEAVYNLNLPDPSGYQATLSSFSNEVCVIHRPIIYIPNAFSPGSNVSTNTTFKPTIIYGDPEGYSMTIFNRWGAIVFESNTVSVGWDGTDHGKEATMGGYGYIIQFTADDGVQIQKQGIVMLIR